MSQKVKEWLTTVREGIIVLVLLVLLLFPEAVNDRMIRAGFTKGNFGGFEWEAAKKSQEEVKAAGKTVADVQRQIEEATSKLREFQSNSPDSGSNEIKLLVKDLQRSADSISVADTKLKTSYLRQEALIMGATSVSTPKVGWIFLGRVNDQHTQWVGGKPQTINSISPGSLQGAVITLRDNVYLRDVTDDKFKTSAPILTVVRSGEQVKVQEIYYSPAKGIGDFVWVKVERITAE